VIEDEQRVAADGPGKDLADACDFVGDDLPQRLGQVVDRMDGDLRYFEEHAMLGELRQRRRGASEPDVQQLDERVALGGGQFHGDVPSSTRWTISTTTLGSAGLVMNPAAPADCASSRDEVTTRVRFIERMFILAQCRAATAPACTVPHPSLSPEGQTGAKDELAASRRSSGVAATMRTRIGGRLLPLRGRSDRRDHNAVAP
jgi:hypothetical protein